MRKTLSKPSASPARYAVRNRQEAERLAVEMVQLHASRIQTLNEEVNASDKIDVFPGQNAKPGVIYSIDQESQSALRGSGNGQDSIISQREVMQMANARQKELANAAKEGRSLANEERFTAAYYSDPLTQYAVGWTDTENLEAFIDFIAPRVPVGRRFEFKSAVNVEAFLSEINDARSIGSEFKEVEYKGTTVNAKTFNRGLKYRLDLDEEGAGILTEEMIVSRLLQRCKRNQYRRAVSTLTTASAAYNTNVTWTYNSVSNPNPQPDEDLRTLIQSTQTASGVFPNRVLADLKSWNIRKRAYAAQALSAGAIYAYARNVDEVVADQMIDGMMISKALYQSSEWVNPAKSYILGQNWIAFYGQDNPSRDDPTCFKRFVTPVSDGDFRVYRQPIGPKFVDITVEYYDQIYNTANIGLGQLTVT